MAALAASRDTKQKGVGPVVGIIDLGMKAATIAYQGGIAVNDAGVAAPGRTATTLVALGVFKFNYNNSTGAANKVIAEILTGVFKMGNSSAGDLIAATEIGKKVYIVDDQTVAKTDGGTTRSVAGICFGVDSDGGVWVGIGPQYA